MVYDKNKIEKRRNDMKNYDRLKKLYNDIDTLISNRVTSSSPEFTAWRIKAERLLLNMFGKDSIEYREFNNTSFTLMFVTSFTEDYEYVDKCKEDLLRTKAVFEAYLEEMEPEIEITEESNNTISNDVKKASKADYSKVFIVHGHDGALKHEVARLIEKQGIEAIILSEQANSGATVIEKIERYSNVDAAICLFTADDLGKEKNEQDLKFRARQNVVFETGYFMAKLRRENVILVSENDVELPSDLQGVMYTNTSDWKTRVLLELRNIGYGIDFNKLFE